MLQIKRSRVSNRRKAKKGNFCLIGKFTKKKFDFSLRADILKTISNFSPVT